MSKTFEAKGNCLCGAVQFSAKEAKTGLGACHCRMCRQWTGGPSMAVDCGTNVQFEGRESIALFDSSEWAERGFCKKCGSCLFYRLKTGGQYFMMYGLFDESSSSLVFDHQVFIDEKPAHYTFENKTQNMTGEEVFAHFASTQ